MSEKKLQTDIMNALHAHPKVAFAYVNTCGTFKGHNGHRFKAGFPGLSDITGMTTSGQFFAIEVKLPGKKPTKEQLEFIETILKNGGLAGVAWGIGDALNIIDK